MTMPAAGTTVGIPFQEAAAPLGAGLLGSALATTLWVRFGPNWDDGNQENREDLGWYVGPIVGGTVGVWVEGGREGRNGRIGPTLLGAATGLALGALAAEASEGDSGTSYFLLGVLPPLGAAIGWALTAGEHSP